MLMYDFLLEIVELYGIIENKLSVSMAELQYYTERISRCNEIGNEKPNEAEL